MSKIENTLAMLTQFSDFRLRACLFSFSLQMNSKWTLLLEGRMSSLWWDAMRARLRVSNSYIIIRMFNSVQFSLLCPHHCHQTISFLAQCFSHRYCVHKAVPLRFCALEKSNPLLWFYRPHSPSWFTCIDYLLQREAKRTEVSSPYFAQAIAIVQKPFTIDRPWCFAES